MQLLYDIETDCERSHSCPATKRDRQSAILLPGINRWYFQRSIDLRAMPRIFFTAEPLAS
jgi:hypothetical protein